MKQGVLPIITNLLCYDGVKWEKNIWPNKTIMRSNMVDGDQIYSGSCKEFDYWFRKVGKIHYTSISKVKNVFDEKENEEIWKIFKFNNKIHLQLFNEIFVLDNNKIKKTKLAFLILYYFIVGNQLLIASVEKGIYKRLILRLKK